MEIKNINKSTPFSAFYRNSQPCIDYLSKGFGGNNLRFKKALEILDARCSRQKYFDMFYSPQDSSIKILPQNFQQVGGVFKKNGYISIFSNLKYNTNTNDIGISEDILSYKIHQKNIIKRVLHNIFDFLHMHKAKKYIVSLYDYLPSNVREAVDLIEKMEHSIDNI